MIITEEIIQTKMYLKYRGTTHEYLKSYTKNQKSLSLTTWENGSYVFEAINL